MTIAYDRAGRETSIKDAFSAYALTYDNADRLTGVDNNGTPGMPRVILTYGYDADGNRTGLDDNFNGLTSYTYDPRDLLNEPDKGSELFIEPDKGSELFIDVRCPFFRFQRGWRSGDGGRTLLLVSWNWFATDELGHITSYTYDKHDNLAQVTEPAGEVVSYGYDALDRPVSATTYPNGTGSAGLTTTTAYDAVEPDKGSELFIDEAVLFS